MLINTKRFIFSSILALQAGALIFGNIDSRASNPYEMALLASGASPLDAAVIARTRTSGSEITRETVNIRQKNLTDLKSQGLEGIFELLISEAKANGKPIPSASRFLKEAQLGDTSTHEDNTKVLRAIYGQASRPLYKDIITTRKLINLLLEGNVAHETLDVDYMAQAESAYHAWLRVGISNPTAQNIQDWIAKDSAVARYFLTLNISDSPDKREAYAAWVGAGVPFPTPWQIHDHIALYGEEEMHIMRALLLLGEEQEQQHIDLFKFGLERNEINIDAYNQICAYHDPTAQELNDYLGYNSGSPADLRQRKLIIMGLDYNNELVQNAYDTLKLTTLYPTEREIKALLLEH